MSIQHPTEWQRYGPKQRFLQISGILITVALAVVSWQHLNVNYEFVVTAPREIRDLLERMYPPDVAYTAEIVSPLLETINMAVLGTTFAFLLAIPVAYLGAENVTPNHVTLAVGKLIIAGTRSINVLVWALIFIIVFGSGALAGVFAIAIRSIGFCAKLLSESIEEISPAQVEGVTATGASPVLVLLYGVVPQIKADIVGITTYRWDINVRGASVLGLVGAGGIGVNLDNSINGFHWDAALTILIAILGIVVFSEVFSAWARGKVR